MQEIAIRVENLGKRYLLSHQAGRQQTFREMLAERARSLAGLTKGSGTTEEFWALRETSLEIQRGEVVGIIGPNGAGKSTFLKLLSRITEPTTGWIEFTGRIASLLEVGTGFHPELSGRENIFLNGAILGMPREQIRRNFDAIVAFAEIERFLDTPVKRYSSGMYMRLAFAVAAHLEPDILLVDEVLAVGDSTFQKKCLGKMKEVAAGGERTVVFVSHNMQAIKSLCTRTARFDHGRVLGFGSTGEIVREYLTAGDSTAGKWVCEDSAPLGDDDFQLFSIEVDDGYGSSGVYLSSNELTVTMSFRLAKPLPGLCVGFDLMTSDGAVVLRSYHTDRAETEWPAAEPGRNTWSCSIPGGLLNGGTYCLCPRVGIHNVRWIVMADAVLQFEMILNHGVSPLWNSLSGKSRPGLIAPILPWTAAVAVEQ